jgi:hypothetical protein
MDRKYRPLLNSKTVATEVVMGLWGLSGEIGLNGVSDSCSSPAVLS